ncbi:aromatic ring-hydroxylating dioxygenase subunit alpha [Sphingomonas naphthae]|uniref:Aromatic ring-hydroxylating dioxygenase subunit alpha n=1 Tax=Sphingomonas naphthae TaxID=1813468 RepID=A0ABY7TIP7_9SPHN|nr:aromatic ring-hydroxylating dioxygenase subunit alpha [Sphingomonas naphthae]WCT73087.1 aromatic ring-hydroxylating dioxygenase subunit alpha [Sphingomonas naphthae]
MNLVRPIVADPEPCADEVMLNDWHAIGFAEDFPAGELVPVTLLGRDLVAWRDSGGTVHVWEDLCIHRGARLSKGFIRNDRVICPYHGWNYEGSGQCVLIPAAPGEPPMKKAKALTHHAQEKYNFVWACIGTPARDIPAFPEWDDASFIKVSCGPYRFKSGYRALENFVDPSHFPFVHAGVNGLMDNPDPILPYEVTEGEEGLVSSEVQVTQPYGDPREVPVIAFYAYRIMRPLVAYFKKRLIISDPARAHEGNEADRFCTFLTAQMVDEQTSIVRICCAMNFDPAPTPADVRRRQDLVYAQDAAIVDTQRPERIPVDLRQELHHRTDLLGMKYRAWLARQGVAYGVY